LIEDDPAFKTYFKMKSNGVSKKEIQSIMRNDHVCPDLLLKKRKITKWLGWKLKLLAVLAQSLCETDF